MPKSAFYERGAAKTLKRLAKGFPIIGIAGPRQSGKMENPDNLDFAQSDFENFVISEVVKEKFAHGDTADLYFWRDHVGLEVDLIIDKGQRLLPVEIKSGQTIAADFFKSLEKWSELAGDMAEHPCLVYGGKEDQGRSQYKVLSWRNVDSLV